QRPVVVAQRAGNVAEAVDLTSGRLPFSAWQRNEVVPEERRRTGRYRTRGALCRITGVPGNAVFGCYVRTDHLEQIELRGHLKEAVLVGRIAMERCDVSGDGRELQPAAKAGGGIQRT